MIMLLAGCSQTAVTPFASKELQQNGVQVQPKKSESIELNKSTARWFHESPCKGWNSPMDAFVRLFGENRVL